MVLSKMSAGNINTISCNQIARRWRLSVVCGRAKQSSPFNVNNLLARNRRRYNRFVHSIHRYKHSMYRASYTDRSDFYCVLLTLSLRVSDYTQRY